MVDPPEEQPQKLPKGFDPEHDTLLDAKSLRGMAHPLRPQILGLLRADGPSTATKIADRLGLSSAATSYHLRQLAAYGFIEEDEGRGTTRERWWKAKHQRTWFDPRMVVQRGDTEDPDAGETDVLAHDYLYASADLYAQKIKRWLDHRDALPDEWQDASTMSDSMLRLTPAEAEQLHHEMKQLVDRYRNASSGERPEGARLVAAQFQVFPHFFPGDQPAGDSADDGAE
ncbi:MAG: helix-turn-helix domain-containing protein [Streptosporangiales bacterium]|nr:helix-turn-helix domain-containing protein [Streptosporangiales bacterium]